MIKFKHFMELVEPDDGTRVWIEPFNLTNDLRQWCSVDEVWPHFGPPRELWEWFEQNPMGYEHFRGRYHEYLENGELTPELQQLVVDAANQNLTLLYQGTDPTQNTATALYEFLSALNPHCPPDV